jgi:hypothetical protein
VYRSINTIGADVARRELNATGEGIVWAVLDSGIDATHEHFRMHRNLEIGPTLRHCDFTTDADPGSPLVDEFGHGTLRREYHRGGAPRRSDAGGGCRVCL